GWIYAIFPWVVARVMLTQTATALFATAVIALMFGGVLLGIRALAETPNFDALLTVIYGAIVIVIGISVWMYLLIGTSRKNAMEEAERQSERLLREIRAHERTDLALQEAKDKAEAANLAKTRYMSGLSHELRTPLNAIYGFAQLLEKDKELGAWRNSLTSIRRSSEHLAGLIDGLLDISRIEAGRLEVMSDRINLQVFLNQITSIFEDEAQRKGIRFRMRTEGRLPAFVRSDEKRLRQIIINLLSNAFRYTEEGSVDFKMKYRNEVAVIEVRDTGVGISEENMTRIWRPFERANRSDAHGSGLGLTITKLLVEILGGQIELESQVNMGSMFRVRLMLPSVAPSVFGAQGLSPEPSALPVTGYEGPRKTVLAVDDDTNHLALLDKFLSDYGFVVLCATNVEMAEAMLADAVPHIILLDIDMPGRDGWSFARSLRQSAHANTPIIMISGHANEERQHRPELGLHDAFVAKPYNLDDLVLQIAELLKITLTVEGAEFEDSCLPLSTDDRAKLLDLAQLGHASALRTSLEALTADRRGDRATIRDLTSKLEKFDMAGIVHTLESYDDRT
ncbi:MAG: ATP-binding protein, partial [Pseudomonadota bacterium]